MQPIFYQRTLRTLFITGLLFTSAQAFSADINAQPIGALTPINNTVFNLQVNSGFTRTKTQTSITGPRGYSLNVEGSTNIDLAKFGEIDDGLYRYEITAPTGKTVKLRKERLDNGRGKNARDTVTESETQSGVFKVVNGSIQTNDQLTEEKE